MKNRPLPKQATFFFLCLAVFLFPKTTAAQFGLSIGYQANQVDTWAIGTDNTQTEISGNGYSVGLDYWFRLKNQRIEFLPELNYSVFSSPALSNGFDFDIDFVSFYFNTNIYLLDLLNDCNCPTFSKQNDFFKKGFFIQVSPGLTLPNFWYSDDESTQFGELQANIALGLGLDIGLTDILTLTPIIRARYQPGVAWNGTFPDPQDINNPDVDPIRVLESEANIWQYFAGLRLGIRLDDW